MTPSKKPERDCDSMEVTLFNRGWNAAIAALNNPPAQPAPVQEPKETDFPRALRLYDEAVDRLSPAAQPAPAQESDLIARLKHPEHYYEFTDPKKANAVLMSLCQEAADALAAPVQEPVAIGWDTKTDMPIMGYTTPPAAQRQWVGLTARDWNVIGFTAEFRAGAEWANDKLKEKNNG